jgi:hypothetical protein
MRKSCLQVSAVALVVLVMIGCGGTYDSSVSGTVTLDGAAVPRGTVAYYPKSAGPIAYSPIESDGSYRIRTGREEGLKAGEYQVTVTANEASAQLESKTGGPMPPGKSLTPLWYRSKDSSGLTFTVERGSNEINLELTSQPPAGGTPR